jgi:hypothetical protein
MFLVAFPMISLTSALSTDVTDYEAVPSLGQLVLTLWVGEHWQALATDIRDLTKRRDELEAELNEVRVMSLTGNPVPIHTFLNLEVLPTYTRFFLLLFMCPFDDFPFPWNIKTKIIHHWNKVWWMWVGCNYHIIASFRMLL